MSLNNQTHILIAPGSSVVLQRIAQKLVQRPDVSMMDTANALLWHLRRAPATHVLAATELDDFDATDLIDIVPALAPDAYLTLCGAPTPELTQALKSPRIHLISSVQALAEWVQDRDLDPPTRTAPSRFETVFDGFGDAYPASFEEPRSDMAAAEVLDTARVREIQQILGQVRIATDAQTVVVSDLAGMVLAQIGTIPPAAGSLFAPMLGALFSTATELGRLLERPQAQRLYVQAGGTYTVYAMAADERCVLSVIRKTDGARPRPILDVLQRAVRGLAGEAKS